MSLVGPRPRNAYRVGRRHGDLVMTLRLCDCKEPAAGYDDWPENMHRHPGCIVYHAGTVCQIPEPQPSLDFTSENNKAPTGATAGADFKGERNEQG